MANIEISPELKKKLMDKLFTHTDLDGIGCSILGKIYYGTNNINVEYCEYNNINEKVLECDFERYEKIFITDLSVNDEVAEKIDKLNGKFNLIDHHETALWLNKYDWAQVKTKKEDGKKESGTSLLSITEEEDIQKHLAHQ
jgi:oligoribonuclease NrnB/cAMP/cGMP phosphodiesterase (DHH superfamily)